MNSETKTTLSNNNLRRMQGWARAIYPGTQKIGVPNTIALGIGGSIVGGLIAWGLGYRPDGGAFQGAGWIMSIVGALIVVWGATALNPKKT